MPEVVVFPMMDGAHLEQVFYSTTSLLFDRALEW
jgi:hypothetical protein